MLKQTQGNPFEKHARPSGGGRQPPVWTWFAQGDDGPKRPARNTWLQDGAQATSGNFIERRERERPQPAKQLAMRSIRQRIFMRTRSIAVISSSLSPSGRLPRLIVALGRGNRKWKT